MKRTRLQAFSGSTLIAAFGLTGALLTAAPAAPTTAIAQSSGLEAIVGAWLVEVTLRDCSTDAPLGAPILSLVTFHRGGTQSEAAGGTGFVPGQLTPGLGTWTHLGGSRYRQRFARLINFETPANLPGTPSYNPSLPVSPGFFAGGVVVTHTVQLNSKNQFTSAGTNAFYKSNGEQYRAGCSTAIGARFE